MKRIHSEQPNVRRERSCSEVLALNPRDPDMVRDFAVVGAARCRKAGIERIPGIRPEQIGTSTHG
jgi:hypothetical protein